LPSDFFAWVRESEEKREWGKKQAAKSSAMRATRFRSETTEPNLIDHAGHNRAFSENLSIAALRGVCFLFGMIAAVAAINSKG
jgi:hypothetical protein